jgi:hypothetical protein
VVDVHARIGGPCPHEVVDQSLERGLLLGRVGSPVRSEPVAVDHAEEVLQSVLAEERVAFDVEEHVTGRRLGK